MEILDFEQRSPEWYAARCGIPTASRFKDIVTSKGLPSTSRKQYLRELAGEKATGIVIEKYCSAAMARGTELEPEARSMYELITGRTVEEVGFCKIDDPECGASPDGFVENGGLEIKCLLVHNHIEHFLAGELPTEYFQQVQGSLFVTGREWWDFMSYYPGLKPLIVRVYPDMKFHAALKVEIKRFCEELNQIVERIKS